MSWIFISIGAYFLNAVSQLTGKFLLRKLIASPAAYAFFASTLGLAALLLAPFDLQFPGWYLLSVSLGAGVLFTAALFLFYTVLRGGEASRVIPLVSGVSPVFVFVLAWLLLGESLSPSQMVAFFIIVVGGYLISLGGEGRQDDLKKEIVLLSVAAAFLFALSHVLTKLVYVEHSFVSGLVWRSLGGVLGAFLLLVVPRFRREIVTALREPHLKTGFLFLFGQVLGAVSFILVNYAFSKGSVALVNALSGTQYLFLFFLIIPLAKRHPRLWGEAVTVPAVRRKLISIVLLCIGTLLLFL